MAHHGSFSYGTGQGQGASPAPPAPYGNPSYTPNAGYAQFYSAQTNQSSAPYQQQQIPPPQPPSQTQPGYMQYNPVNYGVAGTGIQNAPALPPRNQVQTQIQPANGNWANSASHGVTEAAGKSRYNVRPSQWDQTHGHHRVYEGWHQHDYGHNSQTQNTPAVGHEAAPLSPPVLPPRPLSTHGYPAAPLPTSSANPASQAYFANQAYIQQSSTNAIPWGPTYQSGAPLQQDGMPAQTPPKPLTQQVLNTVPGHVAAQGVVAPGQPQGWFNPGGSIFPQYVPPGQPNTTQTHSTVGSPAQVPRPTVSPSPLQHVSTSGQQAPTYQPPRADEPVSPIDGRQGSYSSLYDAPRPVHQSLSQLVSRENSLSGPAGAQAQQQSNTTISSATLPPMKAPAFGGGFSDWQHFAPASAEDVNDEQSFVRKNEASIAKHANAIEIMELDSTPISLPLPKSETKTGGGDAQSGQESLGRAEESQTGITPIIASYADSDSGHATRTASPTSFAKNESTVSGTAAMVGRPRTPSMDIAPSLDVWYKNSLMRFLAVLYKEQAAEAIEEKHRLFRDFMIEEAKIRGLESELRGQDHKVDAERHVAAPASSAAEQIGSAASHAQRSPAATDAAAAQDTAISGQADDLQFSPGGRPIMRPSSSAADPPNPGATATAANSAENPRANATDLADAGRHAADDNQKQGVAYVPFRAGATSSAGSAAQASAIGPQPSGAQQPGQGSEKPAYTSLYKPYNPSAAKSGDDKQGAVGFSAAAVASSSVSPPVVPTQPLTSSNSQVKDASPKQTPPLPQQQNHGRTSSIASATSHRPEHNEIFLDGQAQPAPAQPAQSARDDAAVAVDAVAAGQDAAASTADTAASLKSLETLAFDTSHATSLNPRLENLKTSLMLYPSDYTFITTAFDTWKIKAASARARAETDARDRATESQQRIDQLYDEKQISYSDIKMLEDTFNQQEAQIRARQNEAEYESYLTDVFDPLYKRLQEEVGAVTELLSDASNLAREEGVAGTEMRELYDDNWADKVDLAESLRVMAELHTKREERQDHLADCIMKRDRRRRAIDEIGFNGADKLTQIDFRRKLDAVERSANVAKCEARKTRIQPVWQTVKLATMRGLKENKALMEEITAGLEAVSANDEFANAPKHEQLKEALSQTLQALTRSSESLAESFYSIDVDLNLAEYAAAVAGATLDGAPKAVIVNLGEEKAAEDANLKKGFEARVEDVRTRLRTGQAAVEKASRGKLAQAEFELRQQKALEAAKRRNQGVRDALAVSTPI